MTIATLPVPVLNGTKPQTYSSSQLDEYFARTSLSITPTPSLEFLTTLLRHQLTSIPFESLALHYSTHRQISIDPQDLFTKLVTHRRGGYCLENNTFVKHILRSLGFHVVSVVCRISNSSRGIHDGGWRGMSHMANVVTINRVRYLVDVGFGGDGPCKPVPLDGEVCGERGQVLTVQKRHLREHCDDGQWVWVWVYSQTRRGVGGDVYHFLDVEMLHADFEILNQYNMVKSAFASTVVVQRFIEDGEIIGSWLLVRDTLKRKVDGEEEVVVKMETEGKRLAVFERYFGIVLTEEQVDAIKGRPTELVAKDMSRS